MTIVAVGPCAQMVVNGCHEAWSVIRCNAVDAGIAFAAISHPLVIVLDVEGTRCDDGVIADYRSASPLSQVVLVGRALNSTDIERARRLGCYGCVEIDADVGRVIRAAAARGQVARQLLSAPAPPASSPRRPRRRASRRRLH